MAKKIPPAIKDLLSREAINNRFVQATSFYTNLFFNNLTRETRMSREKHVRELMAQKGFSRAKAIRVIRAEEKRWKAEYDSPLKVAERRIAELERHLEEIKEHINDPHYLDKHSDP